MFAVIYRFYLQVHQIEQYHACWEIVADYFINECGAIGSCLHQGPNNLWVAYSRWPSKEQRDAAWPSAANATINTTFPLAVKNAIATIQEIKLANQHLEQFEDICLNVVDDKLGLPGKVT